jgi:hypothetical protein
MGIEKAGRILAPALFILNLAPGKITNQAEAVAHAWCQPETKWQVQRPKEVLQVSSSYRIPYRCANRLSKKEKEKKENLITLSHNLDWNY